MTHPHHPVTPSAPDAEGVTRELGRFRTRWQQLLLDRAQEQHPHVLAEVRAIATEHPDAQRRGEVPDLGPGTVADQLVVIVQDALAAGAEPAALEARVRGIRAGLG